MIKSMESNGIQWDHNTLSPEHLRIYKGHIFSKITVPPTPVSDSAQQWMIIIVKKNVMMMSTIEPKGQ